MSTLLQISYHGSGEGESDDSEGENQELAQIDRGVYTSSTFPHYYLSPASIQIHVYELL